MGCIRQVPKPAPTLREKHTVPHTHIFSFPLANSAMAVTVDPPTNTGFSPPPAVANSPFNFIDAHCHIDRLLDVAHQKGTLVQFLSDEAIETTNFLGCIANFCDEATLTDGERWTELVDDHFVTAAAVGFHPKHAPHFTQDTDRVIRRLLDHP